MVMDVKDPILHGMGRNNLESFVTASDKNFFVVNREGLSSPIVKFATYFDAEGVGELLMDHLIKFFIPLDWVQREDWKVVAFIMYDCFRSVIQSVQGRA